MNKYIGTHIDSENIIEGAEQVKKSGGNIIQTFALIAPDEPDDIIKGVKVSDINKYFSKNNMKIVIHASYTINLARDWDEYSWWIKSLELEIKYAHYVNAIGIVVHFGKKLDLSIEQAFNNMFTSLLYVHNQTLDYNIPILLETPTGQGSEICFTIDELARFYKKFSNNKNELIRNRFKLCLDTCHLFAAGYDFRHEKEIDKFLNRFDDLIGLNNVKLIHFNDSKGKLGDKKDRHENIGKGYIGINGLIYFFKYFVNLNIPIILETPNYGFVHEIPMLFNELNNI